MNTTPRPWYRSPVLWFGLPGLVFLLWAWVHSMHRVTNLDLALPGYSVRVQNDGSTLGASWREIPSGMPAGREFHFEVLPRPRWATKYWFPLPSYVVNHVDPARPWHYLDFPHWFLLLAGLGLWQLPWLARHFRQKRIARGLPVAPVPDTH
jgi:hypothetical protein